MYKFLFLNLLLLTASAQAMELAWDEYEAGIGLHVFARGTDKEKNEWTGREIQQQDLEFYQKLFGNPEVVKLMGDGKPDSPETVSRWVEMWVERFRQGKPFGKITILQDQKAVGCVQLGKMDDRPGVGILARAFDPSVQGKGLGISTLKFLVEEWAPALRKIGCGHEPKAPLDAMEKFRCFAGKELQVIYTTASPSNPASWQAYKHFDFHPSPATPTDFPIVCNEWEESHHGPLEGYLVQKYFSQNSLCQLQVDVPYDMIDEHGVPRTLSFVNEYNSLRYHFEHVVK